MLGWMDKLGGADHARSPMHLLRADHRTTQAALAKALALSAARRAGREGVPACWRGDLRFASVWEQTFDEALAHLLRPDAGDMSVAEAAQALEQDWGLDAVLMPVLRSECGLDPGEARDCAGAVARVYAYLRLAGEGLGEAAFGPFAGQGADPLLAGVLAALRNGAEAPGPGRVFALLRRDVLDKARTLALSAVFGVQHRHGLSVHLGIMRQGLECSGLSDEECEAEVGLARLFLTQAMAASDPADLRARLKPLGLADYY